MNKSKILYVDDEKINLILFDITLKNEYKILTSENAMKGLEILEKNPDIKIVISDLEMPVMNGIEFIKKAKIRFPEIFYFVLSGSDVSDDIQEAINSGLIQKYFKKPYNMHEILMTFKSYQ